MGRSFSYKVFLGLGLMLILLMIIGQTVFAAGEKPWEKIEWNKPVPAPERLSADEYILPEGWQQAVKGVERILHFNAGSMEHDPGTLANFKLLLKNNSDSL